MDGGYVDVLARRPNEDLYRYGVSHWRKFEPPYPKIGHGWADFTIISSTIPQDAP